MARSGSETKRRILAATLALTRESRGEVTLDQVAARVGLTRQAVLHHFASKDRLLWELGLQGVAAESEAVLAAIDGVRGAHAVVAAMIRALVAYYRADIDRFRMQYLRVQVLGGEWLPEDERVARLYPTTGRMYAAVEAALRADPDWPAGLDARRVAVAAHFTAVGFATMDGLTLAVGDPYRDVIDAYVDALVEALGVGLR